MSSMQELMRVCAKNPSVNDCQGMLVTAADYIDGLEAILDKNKAAVHAINCHDELVDALTRAMAFIDSHVADPDITDEMTTNWMQLKSANPWLILTKTRGKK